jgi:FkbM family methyltransferase
MMARQAVQMNTETVDIDGTLIAIDRTLVSEVILGAMRKKQYEHVEARIGSALMNEPSFPGGQILLEVGAGLGYVGSCLFRTGKVERLVCYEGNPSLIPLIKETHRLNGVRSEARNAILGERSDGTTDIYVPKDFWAASTAENPRADKVTVPCASFQQVIADEKPTFLMVDIEGGEEFLFDSVTSLGTIERLLIEIHQPFIGRKGIQKFFMAMNRLDMVYDQKYSTGKVLIFQRSHLPL